MTKRLVRVLSLLCIRHVPTGWNHHQGLTVCIVSRLNQQIEVMCRCSLLKCKVCTVNVIDLVKIEALWMARIWGDAITLMRFHRDSIDAICVIPWGFQGAALRPAGGGSPLDPPPTDRLAGPSLFPRYIGFLSATLVEHVVRLTCFCRVWCEWYGLNVMWWFVWPACRKLTQPGWGCTIIV